MHSSTPVTPMDSPPDVLPAPIRPHSSASEQRNKRIYTAIYMHISDIDVFIIISFLKFCRLVCTERCSSEGLRVAMYRNGMRRETGALGNIMRQVKANEVSGRKARRGRNFGMSLGCRRNSKAPYGEDARKSERRIL
uniref:Uncharacterized protein n=1 Tax=Steinernema glaseri TaxID=37863 RepID=A0A1I7Y7K3_9BILA